MLILSLFMKFIAWSSNMISFSGKIFSENSPLTISLDKSEDVHSLFSKIWKQIDKMNILPLLSAIRYETEDVKREELTDLLKKHPFSLASFWVDLLAYATDLQNLKSVIQIMYNFTDLRILPLLKDLLKKLKVYWDEDGLVGGFLRLINELNFIIEIKEDSQSGHMIEPSVISSISVLLSLLFAKDPSSMDLHKKINFPSHPTLDSSSVPLVWFEVIQDTLNNWLINEQDSQPLANSVCKTLPIMGYVLDQIGKDHVLAEECMIDNSIDEMFKSLETLISHTGEPNDIVVVIESGIMLTMVNTIKELSMDEEIFRMIDYDLIRKVIEVFLEEFDSTKCVKAIKILTSKCRKLLIPQLISIINASSIFKSSVSLYHETVESCLGIFVEILEVEKPSDEFARLICKPIVFIIVDYFNKNTQIDIDSAAMCLGILFHYHVDCESSLVENILPFLATCMKKVVTKREIHRSNEKEYGKKLKIRKSGDCNYLTTSSLEIMIFFSDKATVDQLITLQAESDFLGVLFHLLKISERVEIISRVLAIISNIVEFHSFQVLPCENLVKHISLIWQKMNTPVSDVKVSIIWLTYWLALNVPEIDPSIFTNWKPYLIEHAKTFGTGSPQQPGLLRLAWVMVKSGRPKQLIKNLQVLAADKSIDYAISGQIESAKIYRLIADLIVDCLEKDHPDCDSDYLIELTQCMVTLAKSSSLDEELYVLEDLVSPAMWLLEKQDDEKIVANVKQFVRILH